MSNDPVDPVSTDPPSQPTVPAIADLFTAKQRSIIYLLSILLAPAYLVVESNASLHWGILAVYAAWNALVGALAVSNVPRLTGEPK